MVAFALVAVATYFQVKLSAPGAAIDMLLGHLAEWPTGIWKAAGGFLAASLAVGYAFPGVSFEELRTGISGAWRTEKRPYVPCETPQQAAATMLVYGGLFIAVILLFGGL